MKNKAILVCLFILFGCAQKKQITVFDANMVARSTAECETALKEISEIQQKCEHNKNEIQSIVSAIKK